MSFDDYACKCGFKTLSFTKYLEHRKIKCPMNPHLDRHQTKLESFGQKLKKIDERAKKWKELQDPKNNRVTYEGVKNFVFPTEI